MKKIILLFFGLIIVCQLLNGQAITDKPIRIISDIDDLKPIKMSELFSEIRYLPLETNPNCLIGYMNVKVFGKNILINSFDGGGNIYRFSENGKFLNEVGKKGRGPGEYEDAKDVCIFGDTVYVVSNFSSSILCYSLDGAFLKKYKLKFNGWPSSILKLPDNSFLVSLTNTTNFGRLLKTDGNFNVLKGYFRNNPIRYTSYFMSLPVSSRGIFYFYEVIDTIYEVSGKYPKPAIIIDHGKYGKPKNFISSVGDISDDDKYPTNCILEISNNYLNLMLYYGPKRISSMILYRFSDGKRVQFEELINDIDNGITDRWFGQLRKPDQMIFTLMPTTILDRFAKMTNAEKHDPKSLKFVEMASKITLESNPVLMICKLK